MKIIVTTIFLFSLQICSYAKEDYSYPELMVQPSASQRVLMEAREENHKKFYEPSAMQISALTTLTAGIMQFGNTDTKNDPDKLAALAGTVVGGGWLVFNYFYFNRRDPYQDAYRRIKSMPNGKEHERLAKERIAEESLRKQAKYANKLAWMSMGTNMAASVYMAVQAESKTTGQILDVFAAAASFLPLIFNQRSQETYETHQNYKKKIYAPLVGSSLFYNKQKKTYIPGLSLSYIY